MAAVAVETAAAVAAAAMAAMEEAAAKEVLPGLFRVRLPLLRRRPA